MSDTSINASSLKAMGQVLGETSKGTEAVGKTANKLFEQVGDANTDLVTLTNTAKAKNDSFKDFFNKAVSKEGLTEKRNELVKLKEQYEKEMADIDNKIEQAKNDIEQATKEHESAVAKADELQAKLEQEQAELNSIQEDYKDKQEKHEDISGNMETLNAELQTISDQIDKYTESLSRDASVQQQNAFYNALNNYDESKDGDWDSYLQQTVEKATPDIESSPFLSYLRSQSKNNLRELASKKLELKSVDSDLSSLETKITTKGQNIANYSQDINAQQQKVQDTENQKAAAEATLASTEGKKDDYPAKIKELELEISDYDYLIEQDFKGISDEEWAFVEKNNVDLSEKLPNGDARYLIAPGIKDGQYHIYDMAKKGASLVRQFADKSQGVSKNGKVGTNIISFGNGYLKNYTSKSKGDGRIVFSYADCNSYNMLNACYKTCSPLSFDLNNDGVKTSGVLINFDIDGDGKMDTINDSADAILVFDKDGDGISGEDGSETFGNNTDLDGDGVKDGYKDGFEALKALAKKENLIGENDNKLDAEDLKILEEKYGLKMKTEGYNSEAKSLSKIGIEEINLSASDETTMQDNFDGRGNQLMTQQGATFVHNGQTKQYADIWHLKHEESSQNIQSNSSISSNIETSFKFDDHSSRTNQIINDVNKNIRNDEEQTRKIKFLQKQINNRAEQLMSKDPKNIEDNEKKEVEEEQKKEDE